MRMQSAGPNQVLTLPSFSLTNSRRVSLAPLPCAATPPSPLPSGQPASLTAWMSSADVAAGCSQAPVRSQHVSSICSWSSSCSSMGQPV